MESALRCTRGTDADSAMSKTADLQVGGVGCSIEELLTHTLRARDHGVGVRGAIAN